MRKAKAMTSKIDLEQLDWFKIENYQVLTEITLQQLFNELIYRISFLKNLGDEEEAMNIFPNTPEWKNILQGQILVTNDHDNHLSCQCISTTRSVSVVTRRDIINYNTAIELSEEPPQNEINISKIYKKKLHHQLCQSCLKSLFDHIEHNNIFQNVSEIELCIPLDYFCNSCQILVDELKEITPDHYLPNQCRSCEDSTMNLKGSEILFNELLLKVNVSSSTRHEIHAELDLILDEYRKKTGEIEPKRKAKKSCKPYFQTIIKYNLIPYMDLLIWANYCAASDKPFCFSNADGTEITPSYKIDFNSSEVNKISINSRRELLFSLQQHHYEKDDSFITKDVHAAYEKYKDNEYNLVIKNFLNMSLKNRNTIVKDYISG
jgi:hypothetical protein